ncbi:MAG: DMT family transporter [Clostridia bacterium]|nr:DMT family transporter [Clostridia bacterium]
MKITEKTHRALATPALFAAALIWGSTFVTMKDSLDEMKPGYLLAVRFTIAAVFMLLLFVGKWKKYSVKYILPSALIGLTTAVAYIVQTFGLKYTTPGKNAFLTSIYCVLIPFFYWIITKKRPDAYNFIAAFLCVIGVGLVSIEISSLGDGFFIGKGEMLTICCSAIYAIQMMLMAKYSKELDSALLVTLQFVFTSLCCWIFTLIFEGAPTKIGDGMIFDLLYLAIAASALALLFQNYGIKHTSAGGASIILSLESVFGVIFSVIAGEEGEMTIQKAIGFAVVFLAVIVSETKLNFLKKKKQKATENSDESLKNDKSEQSKTTE